MLAFHLGRRLKLEEAARQFIDRVQEKSKSDLCLRLGEGQVYLFSFGAVVFSGVELSQAELFLEELPRFVEGPSERLVEDFILHVDPDGKEKVFLDRITLQQVTPQKLRLISLVLAQSATLEYYEQLVEGLLDRASAFTNAIAQGGKWGGTTKEMLSFLGTGMNTRRIIVSNLAILDSPDIVWEEPALDALFQEHKANFELASRFRTLEYKLRLIHESVETLVELGNTRHSNTLEVVVVILIAVEVLLAFLGHGR